MKRKDINGFSFKFFTYYFEVVTIKHIPKVLAISKPLNKVLFRLEI